MVKKIFRTAKIVIDLAMYVIFLLLMERHLLSGATHEWLGISLFVLFITHNLLNYRFYTSLFNGKYSVIRIVQTIIDLLLLIAMLLCIASSMMISGTVFKWLNLSGTDVGREIHLISTAWTFILMSLHLGLHWSNFVAMDKKIRINLTANTVVVLALRAVVIALGTFGVYVFISRCFYEEMFLLASFKFFDYDKNIIVYLLETFSMSVVFVAIAYYAKSAILTLRLNENKKEKQEGDRQ